MTRDRTLFTTGVVGATVAALCCGTPVLATLLGTLGVSAWLAYADYVLLPVALASTAVAGYAAYRLRRRGKAA